MEQFDDSPESAMMEAVIEAMSEYYSKKSCKRNYERLLNENAILKGKSCGGIPPLDMIWMNISFIKSMSLRPQGVNLFFKLFGGQDIWGNNKQN